MKPSHANFSLHCAAAAVTALLFTLVLAHSQVVTTTGTDEAKSKSQFGITSESETRRVQIALRRLGYYTGGVDGFMGQETQVAIAKFQVDHNLPVRAKITHSLLVSLGLERHRS